MPGLIKKTYYKNDPILIWIPKPYEPFGGDNNVNLH